MRNHLLRAAAGTAASGGASGHVTDSLLCNLDAESYSGSGDLTDSANSNDGTILGATFVSTSPKHFVMDGSNDYIGLGTQLNSSLAPNSEDNDASFSFWINLDAVNADQTIFSNPKKLSNIPFLLYYDIDVYAAANNDQTGDIGAGNTNVLSVLMKDASTQYVMTTANNAVSASTWYNIVVVLNPSNDVHKIYLNNVLVAKYNSSVANNLSTITADLNIGAASDSSTMDGKFAQFLAYTKALTDAEVQQNWNAFKGRFGYGTGIPASNLELYINPSSYSSGTTVPDSSGNSRTYNLNNGVVHNTSPNRFTLDGSNDYLAAASNYSITTGNGTFVVWIKRNGNQNEWTGIFHDRVSSANGVHFYDDSNKIAYTWNNSNSTYSWQSDLLVADATWTMVAVSVNSSSVKAYRYTSSSTPSTATNSNSHSNATFQNLSIGRDNYGSYRYFNGDIGQALFYSSTLTDSQITQIYNTTKSTYGY